MAGGGALNDTLWGCWDRPVELDVGRGAEKTLPAKGQSAATVGTCWTNVAKSHRQMDAE